jgi:hypothetical protein
MVSEARRMALQTFRAWGMDSAQAELACLLVSEVVTNAVLHTSAAARPRREFGDVPVGAVAAPPVSPMPWEVPEPVMDDSPAGFAAAAPKDFAMRLRRGSAAVWVEVFDPDMRLPRIRSAEDSDEGGRGLYLVEQLATRWGSRPTRDGKAVWFEMPIDGQSS